MARESRRLIMFTGRRKWSFTLLISMSEALEENTIGSIFSGRCACISELDISDSMSCEGSETVEFM